MEVDPHILPWAFELGRWNRPNATMGLDAVVFEREDGWFWMVSQTSGRERSGKAPSLQDAMIAADEVLRQSGCVLG